MLKASEPDKTRDILEFLGPAAGVVKNLQGLLPGSQMEAKMLLPLALQNMLKGSEMMQSGLYKDTRAKTVMEVTPADSIFKFIGFQPHKIAQESRIVSTMQQDIALHNVIETSIADDIAQGMVDKDKDAVKSAMERMQQWNKDNPELPVAINANQIAKRIAQIVSTREQRMIKSAPKEMRSGVIQELRQ